MMFYFVINMVGCTLKSQDLGQLFQVRHKLIDYNKANWVLIPRALLSGSISSSSEPMQVAFPVSFFTVKQNHIA